MDELRMDEYRKEFQKVIDIGLKNLVPTDQEQLVANLSFKRDTSDEIAFNISLVGHDSVAQGGAVGQERIYPKIKISFGNNSISWIAKWSLPKLTSDGELKFWFSDLLTSWTFLRFRQEGEEEVFSLPEPSGQKLPGFRTPVDEDFLQFWFQTQENIAGAAPEIERTVGEWCALEFQEEWKAIKLDGRDFSVSTELFASKIPVLPSFANDEDDDSNNEKLAGDWAKLCVVLLCWRFILTYCPKKRKLVRFNKLSQEIMQEDVDAFYRHLPELKEYRPKRPVDINPQALWDKIKLQGLDETEEGQDQDETGLEIPWHVVASATAALNAGKHIIFTGAPGCGKTHLARIIAEFSSGKSPLMATASQAWTTDEIIGRYMPTINGSGLEFKDGYFLKTMESGQWLIIDEINRCDIDNCFGELFTVLAGQSVVLPFDKMPKDSEGIEKPLPVQIVVGASDDEKDSEQYTIIPFSEKFRLLATMNDSDVAGLNQLSYALRRRFAIIRVDAPDCKTRGIIFQNRIDKVYRTLGLENRLFKITQNEDEYFTEPLRQQLLKLFAKEPLEGDDKDLTDLRVVGIAPVLDTIRFVGEGLRASVTAVRARILQRQEITPTEARRWLLNSYLAMGIVLNVYPQLDAVTGEAEERFKPAVRCILRAFDEGEKFLRIEKTGDNLSLIDSKKTIRQYLVDELNLQYAMDGTTRAWIEEVDDPIPLNTAS